MTDPNALEFRIGKSKSRHGFVIAGIGMLVGLWIIFFGGETTSEHQWIGVLVVLLAAGVGYRAWQTGRQSGAYLRISESGIFFHEWRLTVPWSAVESAYSSGSRLQPFITIRIRDAERFLSSLAEPEARALRGNRLWKSPELRIPYNAVEAPREEVLAAIRARIEN